MDKLSEEDLVKLRNEIVMAEKLNETKLLPQLIEGVQRYTGSYVPPIAGDWDLLLNDIYPIIQYELPAIFFRNPKVFLKPRNKTFIAKRRDPITGKMQDVTLDSTKSASTQEAILNYVLSEINYKQEVRNVLLDALIFKHGILWHGYKGEFGMTEEQSIYIEEEMVFVKRIPPMNFLFDPTVTLDNLEEAKWIGRAFRVPKQDLLDDDTLDVDKKMLKGELGYGILLPTDPGNKANGGYDTITLGGDNKFLISYADKDFKESDKAKFVRVYEIFKRPTKKEKREGKKGRVILFTKEQTKPLRVNPWPYDAKGWPAKPLSFNPIPDQVFGMADLEVFGKIADHKNLVINLQLRNAQENSKTYIGISKEGANEEDITKIRSGDQTIVFFESGKPSDRMFVQSAGGAASNELYQLDTRIQNNLDEKSGIPDIKKGILRSGEESATSVNIRNLGTSARPAYRQDQMADFLKASCHFLNQLLKQYMPVKDAVRIVGSLDVEWSDNPTKEEIQAETDVELDVISMLPEDPDKEIQQLMTILNLMTTATENPVLQQKLQEEGMTFEFTPIIENLLVRLQIRDPNVFRKIRPEESQGFASVSELNAAKSNVQSVLSGQNPPSPPAPGQDHRARLEIYQSIFDLVEELPDSPAKKMLESLIETQSAVAQEDEQKSSPAEGQKVGLTKPKFQMMGAK